MTGKVGRALRRRLKVIPKAVLCRLNYLLGRFDERVFILGEGRSGTTWLANLLNFDGRYRLLFEPFQTDEMRLRASYPSEYPFPDSDSGDDVARHIRRVMRGDRISGFVTRRFPRWLYDGLLIKDITCHLILDDVVSAQPDMKNILIVRHPFAVAISKSKLFNWPTRPTSFLSDQNPRAHEIERHRDLIHDIEQSDDEILVQIVLWCISMSYAMSSTAIRSFAVVFYEDLVTNPLPELKRLFVELDLSDRFIQNQAALESAVTARSHVTAGKNAIETSRQGIGLWEREWSPALLTQALGIVEAFGWSSVYGRGFFPLVGPDRLLETFAGQQSAYKTTGTASR